MENKIFKLSSGEAVDATDLEQQIEKVCHYVKYALVSGEGEEYPVALIFPYKELLQHPDYEISPEEGCFCPRSLNEMGRCITGCLHQMNSHLGKDAIKLKTATIINAEIQAGEANYDMLDKFKAHLQNMYGGNIPVNEDVYVIKLEQ